MSALLEISNLHVGVDDQDILKGVDLTIQPGEVHVVMGPNGAGKSTLVNAIMAHPSYTVHDGDIRFQGESILNLTTDERARKGIFLSFQAPQEVPGVSVEDFLRTAKAQHDGKNPSVLSFKRELGAKLEALSLPPETAERYLNVGFSGGEKKKNEILQMQVLNPSLVMLDETDSGLDVDAVRIVSKGVSEFLDETKGCLIITHISGILESLKPDVVHVLMNGRIVETGGPELAEEIQQFGYQKIRDRVAEEEAHATSR
ncbi:MAG: Fe-S cluster assembly ATPase SufC [Peptoniphilaceae bacterium]|nr:Fe-S cluster assembly ATPase SufC [Peptoniphilaceae bacterium]MDY6086089.1 Fe-S cluster assembly ATPase SufC [Peptoniphilaceae bacterium]